MIKSRINYWSCSKFANWIRGNKKPHALTLEGWEEWREDQEKQNGIRYYIADKLLNRIQDVVYFPKDLFDSASIYLKNRFVAKTHYLKTGFKPGSYHEIDEKILYALFNELVDFVEIELAWMAVISNKNKYKTPFFRRFRQWRSEEAGRDHLKWASELKFDKSYGISSKDPDWGKPTPQAESALEILELYNWWKQRPDRPDPMEVSGWSEICKEKKKDRDKKSESAVFRKMEKIERQYEKEDDKMLLRLIKIRRSLWT
jgi:hypothetical protein